MNRGEVWTVAGGPGYAGKPRPALIVQSDLYRTEHSVTVCGFTTEPALSPFSRPLIEPSLANGLTQPSSLMVDKITTVPVARLGERIGLLAPAEVSRVDLALLVFLGLAA